MQQDVNIQSKPVVSVWVITYNHAKYIGQCLDAILAQQTDFSFEICLGEDESSDGTREICMAYRDRHPDIIRLFLRSRSEPGRRGCAGVWQYNFIETFKACKGEFVALCDGDDFWSDTTKLQRQVDLLRQNPQWSGCFHKIGMVDADGSVLVPDTGYPPKRRDSYSLDYLLRYSTFSPMFSVVFRNHDGVAPDWIRTAPLGDMIVHAINLQYGDYGFIDRVMGYYRLHGGGLASGTSRLKVIKITLEVYRMLGEHLPISGRDSFRRGVRALKVSYAVERLLDFLIPARFKRRFDIGVGKPLRAFARRLLDFVG